MKDIYRSTFVCLQSFWPFYLFFAVALEVAGQFGSGSSIAGAEFAAFTIFAYMLHRHFLFGDTLKAFGKIESTRPSARGRFFLISLPMLVVPIGLAVFLVLGPLHVSSRDVNLLTMILLVVILPLYLLMLSVFGTMLPAAASAEPFGLGLTLSRARRSFWRIFGGLLVGPALFGSAAFIVIILLSVRLGLPLDPRDAQGAFSPVGAAASVLLQMVAMINTTLAVVVLCNAYRRLMPSPVVPTAAASLE